MNEVAIYIKDAPEIIGTLSADAIFTADIGGVPIYPLYEGDSEITPSDTEQTMLTAGKYLPTDITISRISQTEYAHITYDHLQNIRVW